MAREWIIARCPRASSAITQGPKEGEGSQMRIATQPPIGSAPINSFAFRIACLTGPPLLRHRSLENQVLDRVPFTRDFAIPEFGIKYRRIPDLAEGGYGVDLVTGRDA